MILSKGFGVFIVSLLLGLIRNEDAVPIFQPVEFWNFFSPAELVRDLDSLSLSKEKPIEPSSSSPSAFVKKPLENVEALQREAQDRVYDDDSADESHETQPSHDEDADAQPFDEANEDEENEYDDDYEKTYEDFVQQYFSKAANQDEEEKGDSSSNSSVEPHEQSHEEDAEEEDEEDQEVPPPSKGKKKKASAEVKEKAKKNCKTIQEGRHECIVCKNLRNGMNSKTCSYRQEAAPQRYAFEKEKSYQQAKDSDSHEPQVYEDSVESAENLAELDPPSNPSPSPGPSPTPALPLPYQNNAPPTPYNYNYNFNNYPEASCVRQSSGPKTCLHCIGSHGEQTVNCFADYSQPLLNNDYSQQRLFKRTLSYSYAKSSNGSDDASQDQTQGKPKQKRKAILQIIKRKLRK